MTNGTFSSLNEMIRAALSWGEIRGLHMTMDLRPQLVKLTEELGEIAAGVARNDHERILDGVGDLLAVLIQFGAVHSKSVGAIAPETYLEECLGFALQEILHRKGQTRDGVFVRDEEEQ